MRILAPIMLTAALSVCLHAQTIDDGVMIPRHTLFAGNVFSYDSWDHYWETHLNRANGNIGTISTRTDSWYADYGITNRLDLIAQVPYFRTHASQGVLSDMHGFQDITLAAKYNFYNKEVTKHGAFHAFVVATGTIPLTNYEPDFQPLSIGSQSKTISARLTLNYHWYRGWFVNASGGYTWRDSVKIDAPYYYTNGQLYLTDIVDMPEVFNYIAMGGYQKKGRLAQFTFSQQKMQGGGDIRRQDVPFISNHINYTKVGVNLMAPVPKLHDLSVQFGFNYTVDGRDVGQSTTYSTGLLYTVHFPGSPKQ
jgi:hypothetical protein